MTSSTLDQRYGRPRPGVTGGHPRRSPRARRLGAVLTVLALALATVFVAWVVSGQSSAPTFKEVSFDESRPDRASLDFELTKDPDQTVRCAVQALNDQHAIVGWKEVTVGTVDPDQLRNRTSVQRVELRTTSPAHTVTVDSCWTVD